MKSFCYFSLLLFSCVLFSCASLHVEWKSDCSNMRREVKKVKKDALILFTGSDWNVQSMEMLKNKDSLLSVFAKYSKDFVFYHADIVKDENSLPAKILKTNYILASQYYVSEMPHVIVRSFEGDVYFSKKLEEGEVFSNVLKEVEEKKNRMKKLKYRISHSTGKELITTIDEFFSSIYNAENEMYDSLRNRAIASDAKNESGLVPKFKIIIRSLKADRLAVQKQYLLAADEYILLLKEENIEEEERQNAWFQIAYLYALSKKIDNEKIIYCLNNAINAAPNSRAVPRLKEILEKVEKK